MFIMMMYVVPKITVFNYRRVVLMFIKVSVASLVMGALAYFLKSYLNVFLVVGISGIVYFILLFIMRAFRKEDIISIMESFKNKPTASMDTL
jgi:membrane associated rhomboid family serine protease